MRQVNRDIWVYIETAGTAPRNASLELLAAGRRIAEAGGAALTAVVITHSGKLAADSAIAHGADRVIVAEHPAYSRYDTQLYTHVLCTLAEKYQPEAVLIGATPHGRDLAPRAACRLNTGLTADCIALDVGPDGHIVWTRPAFSGNILAHIVCKDRRPQMATVRPGIFRKNAPDFTRRGEIIREEVAPPTGLVLPRLLESVQEDVPIGSAIEDAAILVAVGKGIGSAGNVKLAVELAHVLGGSVAATRTVVENGWLPHSVQVGQTGKAVAPRLYIACGISGALQHLAGIGNAGTIVAINNDPAAPIFGAAHYGIVGELEEVLPALTKAYSNSL